MKTAASRTCAVKAHTRVLPVRPSIDDDLHRRLAREIYDAVDKQIAAAFRTFHVNCWRALRKAVS